MSAAKAQLMLRGDASKVAKLDPTKPFTIGKASSNQLSLASAAGVSEHHAVVRYSPNQGWLVCDWQSSDGTFLEGQRIRRCRPLSDRDEIQLGKTGPVLVFLLQSPSPPPPPAQPTAATQRPSASPAKSQTLTTIDFQGQKIPIGQVRSANVRSQTRYPHLFSWWLLFCLGGLLLLPLPLIFWPLEVGALVGAIMLSSRKDHVLQLELRNGLALRHGFSNRMTALAHRNGIRQLLGKPNPTSAR